MIDHADLELTAPVIIKRTIFEKAWVLEECVCVQVCSDIANYWPGMQNTVFLVVSDNIQNYQILP